MSKPSRMWPYVVALVVVGMTFSAGCAGKYRDKGTIHTFAVQPVYRPSLGEFSWRDIDLAAMESDIGRIPNRDDVVPAALTQLHKMFAGANPPESGPVVVELNRLLKGPSLIDCIKQEDRERFTALSMDSRDRKKKKTDATIRTNKAILQHLYPTGTGKSREPAFAGGSLGGAFLIASDHSYAEANRIAVNDGYRFSFEKVHVRYLREVQGAEFIVYVELYRGPALEPFYVQVIGKEVDMPRKSDLVRTTVMTPAFTYLKDEPILLRIVGVELDTKEEQEAAKALGVLDSAAQTLAVSIPQAAFAPLMTGIAKQLFMLAKDGNDIEFQHSISFYPYGSHQISVPDKLKDDWRTYYVELPLVAAQFALVKDENRLRRVPLDTGLEYVVCPITRGIPSLVWGVSALFAEPYYILTGRGHLRDDWRFPGLIDEPVDEASYDSADKIAGELAVYNDELRRCDAGVKVSRLDASEDHPKDQYEDKTYVLFSLLRTDEGRRDPLKEDFELQLKYLADEGVSRAIAATPQYADALKGVADRLITYSEVYKVFQDVDRLSDSDVTRVKLLLEALVKDKDKDNEYQKTICLQRLDSMMDVPLTYEGYVALLTRFKSETEPVQWNDGIGRFIVTVKE